MIDFWMSLWSLTWFASLAVFTVLSVLVIVFGGYDLTALLKSLHTRHLQSLQDCPSEEPGEQ